MIRDAVSRSDGPAWKPAKLSERELTATPSGCPRNRHAEALLAAVIESSRDGIISVAPDGLITGWNESAERIFGFGADEAIGQSIMIIIPPERVDEEKEILARIPSGARVNYYETVRQRKDGTRLHVSVSISPLKDRKGRIIGASKVCRDITKRVEAEEELRANEAHFRNTFRQITDYAIFSMDPGGAINTWNKGCREMLGYDEAEFLQMNGEQLFVPEDKLSHVPAKELETAQKEGSAREDHWIMRKNGERFWASLTTTALRNDDGSLIGFAKVMRDLTRERQLQEETKFSIDRFRFLSETTRSLLEMRDPVELLNQIYDRVADKFGLEFYFHYLVEPNAQKMRLGAYRGIPMERAKEIEILDYGQAVCGKVARDSKPIVVSDVQHTTEPITDLIRTLGITAYACHPLIANGELLGTLSFGTTRFPAFAPEVLSLIRALCDIVAAAITRKRAEERLAERARLLDLSRDAIVVRDQDQHVVYWNHGAEVLFGWSEAEALGKNPCELLQSIPSVPMHELTEVFNRDDYWEGEITQKARDGREVVVLATGSMARGEKGQPMGILHTYTDITELKRVQRELAKANEELNDYARNLELAVQERTAHLQETIAELEGVSYSLSHDMRAPLRAINSFAGIILAEAGEKLGPLEKDLLRKSISASERLDRLIRDVLIYTRVARGSVSLAKVDVERLLRQIISERPELQAPHVEIDIQTPLGSVFGHEAHLTQCITNLLDNAVKFVAPGNQPRIRIRSESFKGRFRLWFEDNGIGIPRESQERIFGIFQRMHDDKIYPGTGIGLAIVRKAAERMGGSAGLESEPGKGSRFWLQLSEGDHSSDVHPNRRHFDGPGQMSSDNPKIHHSN